MEHFVVSALKYRPQTFKDVVGQQAITNTLQNAIDNNHLAQALLFTGPRGVGKTTCARILAKMINSDENTKADEDFAFNIFELDAASNNSVDDIRSLTDQVRIPPQVGKFKVYIIDEVHMLSSAAFNAFLKTLEEPPAHCIFILATTEKHKIIPTILSRCQIFDFKRITVTDAKEYLKYIAEEQGIEAEDDALHIIAQKADGAMRDALSIFDRVVSFSGKNLTRQAVTENLNVLDYETFFESTDYLLNHNIPDLLVQYNTVLSKGFDGHHYIRGLASHFRDLMVCKNESTLQLLEVGEDTKSKYLEQTKKASQPFLLEVLHMANDCDLKYKASKNQRLLVELCLMQMASINFDGEKKKFEPTIIPPHHFKSEKQKAVAPVKVVHTSESKVDPNQNKAQTPIDSKTLETIVEEAKPEVKKISIDIAKKSTSGLSLKSLKAKKEHDNKVLANQPSPENFPKNKVTQDALLEIWNQYISKINDKGEKIMASILEMNQPKLNGTNIELEFPNATLKIELERAQFPLMEFLRSRLQNYDLALSISVNEELSKQYAFTSAEKYAKLKEKNPNIELLKSTFGLEY